MLNVGTNHRMGAGELRFLAVFRLKDCSNIDKKLLVALLRVSGYQ